MSVKKGDNVRVIANTLPRKMWGEVTPISSYHRIGELVTVHDILDVGIGERRVTFYKVDIGYWYPAKMFKPSNDISNLEIKHLIYD